MKRTKNPFEALKTSKKQNSLQSLSSDSCFFFQHEAFLVVKIKVLQCFTCHGMCAVQVLKGTFQINGFKMTPGIWRPLFSTTTQSFMNIEAIGSEGEGAQLLDKEREALKELRKGWKSSDDGNLAIVAFKPLEHELLGLLDLQDLQPVFRDIFPTSSNDDFAGFQIIKDVKPQDARSYHLSYQTKELVKEIKEGIICIVGPLNSGKSSMARYVTNHLLSIHSKVAYLDCDVGQPEFSPCGMVSLHLISDPLLGPQFTHPLQPDFAQFIGSTSPKQDPDSYMNALMELIGRYRSRYSMIPLVVNTSGWTRGRLK